MTKTIILSSGGTGGHVFPALSLAAELHTRGYHVVVMTDHRGQEFQKASGVSKVISLPIWRGVRWGRVPSASCLSVALSLSFFVAWVQMIRLRPVAVVGFGGYPSIPAVLAGYALRLPTALHEQNAILGRANRFLGRFVKRIAISFETDKIPPLFQDKIIYTGNPVRQSIVIIGEQPYQPPVSEAPFRLLIMGGSQGARVFSDVIPKALCALTAQVRGRLVVWQQCRPEYLDKTKEAYEGSGISVELRTFFDDIDHRLQECHFVIARSGASTIAELTVSGRPALLVPYAAAMDNHQEANAVSLGSGAWVVLEKDFTPSKLKEILLNAMNDDKKLADMAQKIHQFGQPQAALKLAQMVEALVS